MKSIGLIERPIPFMYTTFSMSLGIVYLTALYMLLPLYSALEKIPDSYREAAADLGAGPWTRFWRVTLPLSKEGITSGCTLVFLISTGFYATTVLLGGPSTTVFAETIAGFFHVAGDEWPVGAAFASIMLIATLDAHRPLPQSHGAGRQGAAAMTGQYPRPDVGDLLGVRRLPVRAAHADGDDGLQGLEVHRLSDQGLDLGMVSRVSFRAPRSSTSFSTP